MSMLRGKIQICSVCFLIVLSSAYAVFDWSGATDNVWSTDTNWTGGTAPVAGAVSDSLTFGSDAGDFTVTGADGAYTDISAISFDTAGGAYSISGTGSFSLNAAGTIGGTSGFAHTIGVDLVSNAGGGIVFNGTDNLSITSIISGDGTVTQSGAGILTLSGINTYTGGTTLAGGTVITGNDAAFGSGVVTVTADSILQSDNDARAISNAIGINTAQTLTVSGTNNLVLSGIVSGDGSLAKSGTNTLTLSGVNTYTGGTTLGGGTVIAGDDTAFGSGTVSVTADSAIQSNNGARAVSNAVSVAAGQTLTVSGTNNLALSGVVSGAGDLTKSGTNTLTLSGVNTYSGGTTLGGGTVILGDDAALGSGAASVTADSTLQSDNDAHAVSNAVSVAAGQTLTVSGTNNLALSGIVSGAGALTKSGTSTLTLSGVNTYTGTTTLTAGTLDLAGQVSGDLLVNGGLLIGTGTVAGGGNLTLNNGGSFAPGNSIGTTTVTGDYVQNAGSTLEVEIFKDAGNVLSNDQVAVTGTATLEAGSTIEVTDLTPPDRYIATGDTFDIITTGGGVTDNGATITSLSASLSFTGSIVGNDYVLSALRSSFSGNATNPNNAAVLSAIDSDLGAATGDFLTVINELSSLGADELNAAAEKLSPLTHASCALLTTSLNHVFANATTSYLDARRQGSTQIALLGAPIGQVSLLAQGPDSQQQVLRDAKTVSPDIYGQSQNIYLQPFGMYYDQDSTEEFTGFSAYATGATFGFDEIVNDNWIAGFSGVYMHSWIDFDRNLGDGDVDSFRVGPYASYFQDDFYVDTMLSFGYHLNDTERDVVFGGINRTAKADYDSYDISAYLGGGYDIPVQQWLLTPTASVQYTNYYSQSFNETGAGAAGLAVDANRQESLLSRIGLRFHTLTKVDSAWISPEVFAGYAHEFMDEESLQSRLLGGTSKFTTNVDSDRQDSIYFGGGLSSTLKDSTSVFVRYEGEIYSSNESHVLTGGITFLF